MLISTSSLSAKGTAPAVPVTGALVNEITGLDTELSGREGVLWYPDLTSWDTVKNDFSWPHYNMLMYGGDTSTWPKMFHVPASEFGNIPALRFESHSLNPYTLNNPGQGMTGDPGVFISQIWKWFDENRRQLESPLTGSSLWTGPLNSLYMRYSIMMESDVWLGINEYGVKWPGLRNNVWGNEPGDNYCHLWMHTSWPGQENTLGRNPPYSYPTDPISLTTYFNGDQLSDLPISKNWLPIPSEPGAYIMHPGVWYTIEQYWKMNSAQGNGVGNFDGEVDIWLDDQLIFTMRNSRFRKQFRTDGFYDPPSNVDGFHMIIYHGGQGQTPITPIHYRITGICLADRRIGKTRTG